jgi:hypothetical protein
MAFIISEDRALHAKLQGMTVTDQKAENDGVPRQVGVWFGQPDQEIRTQSYPYITIDLINVQRDPTREMRTDFRAPGYLQPDDLEPGTAYTVSDIVPINLDYQITSYARHPYHDRAIMSQLLSNRLPIRFGVLDVDDNTVRRLDVLDVSKRDSVESGKRLFVNAITIRVSSEIPNGTLQQLNEVLEVHIDPPVPPREGGRPGDPYFSGFSSIITQ